MKIQTKIHSVDCQLKANAPRASYHFWMPEKTERILQKKDREGERDKDEKKQLHQKRQK